jgi:CBS domain-containing protein
MVAKRAYELIDRKIVAVSPATTLSAAIKLVERANVELLPVIEKGRLVGVLSERALRSSMHERRVQEVMDPPVYIEKDAGMDEVIAAMMRNDVSRLPVVASEKTMRCLGIISATEVLKHVKRKK